MDDLYLKVDKFMNNCLEECQFKLSEGYTLYSTFFKNNISSVILMTNYIENDNIKEKELKNIGNVIYNTIKKYLIDRKLNNYLILGKKPELDLVYVFDKRLNKKIYTSFYKINIYLGSLDDSFLGYLELLGV